MSDYQTYQALGELGKAVSYLHQAVVLMAPSEDDSIRTYLIASAAMIREFDTLMVGYKGENKP